MPKKKSYSMTQCLLEKKDNKYISMHTAWIPSEFAKKGNKVRISKDDHWDGIWTVKSVGSEGNSVELIQNSQDYKKHRKTTDI